MHIRMMLIGCSMLVVLSTGCGGSNSKSTGSPSENAFHQANLLITASSKGIAHGNTESAKKRAAEFSETMGKLQKAAFTGGDKNRKMSLTGDTFLVYCQQVDDGVCFLVHVPQLKNYKDDVREMLTELAWTTAKMVTGDLHKEKPVKLAVGLRGAMLYGAIATGASNGDPKIETGLSVSKASLIPFFTPKTAAGSPAGSVPDGTPQESTSGGAKKS